MKLLKVISIVLCILVSSSLKAEEFDLINEVLQQPSDIVKKFEDKGFDGVLLRYDFRVKFNTCKKTNSFKLPVKKFTELENAIKSTFGVEVFALMAYGVMNKLITEEDLVLLKAHYDYVEDEIYTRYSAMSLSKDPNLSKKLPKYEDKLRSTCKDFAETARLYEFSTKQMVAEYYYSRDLLIL